MSVTRSASLRVRSTSRVSHSALLHPHHTTKRTTFFINKLTPSPSPLALPILFAYFFSTVSVLSVGSVCYYGFLSSQSGFFSPPKLHFVSITRISESAVHKKSRVRTRSTTTGLTLSPPLPPVIFLSQPGSLNRVSSKNTAANRTPQAKNTVSSTERDSKWRRRRSCQGGQLPSRWSVKEGDSSFSQVILPTGERR